MYFAVFRAKPLSLRRDHRGDGSRHCLCGAFPKRFHCRLILGQACDVPENEVVPFAFGQGVDKRFNYPQSCSAVAGFF